MNTAPFAKQNGGTQFVRTAELLTEPGREAIAKQLGFQTFEQVAHFQRMVRIAFSRPTANGSHLEHVPEDMDA